MKKTTPESYRRYNTSKKGRKRTREYRERKKRRGICVTCTEPVAPDSIYCIAHKGSAEERKFLRGG